MVQFGDFKPLCSETPSYTWCNLFYRQVCAHFAHIDIVEFIRLPTSASTSVARLTNRFLSQFSISTHWHKPNLWYSTYRARRFARKYPKHRSMCSQYIGDRSFDCAVSSKESCCWYVPLPFFLSSPSTVHHSWPELHSGSMFPLTDMYLNT